MAYYADEEGFGELESRILNRLCSRCSNALQPKKGDASNDSKVYRSWDTVRTWFNEYTREEISEAMHQERNTCYTILNYVYLKDAPQDIVHLFLQSECLTLLQLCMLALSRAKEPHDDERRSKSWDPVRKWFGGGTDFSVEQAQKCLGETNHVGETAVECVGTKQAPTDVCNFVANLQKTAARGDGGLSTNSRWPGRVAPSKGLKKPAGRNVPTSNRPRKAARGVSAPIKSMNGGVALPAAENIFHRRIDSRSDSVYCQAIRTSVLDSSVMPDAGGSSSLTWLRNSDPLPVLGFTYTSPNRSSARLLHANRNSDPLPVLGFTHTSPTNALDLPSVQSLLPDCDMQEATIDKPATDSHYREWEVVTAQGCRVEDDEQGGGLSQFISQQLAPESTEPSNVCDVATLHQVESCVVESVLAEPVRQQRLKPGYCNTCKVDPVKCHDIKKHLGVIRERIPLTIPGRVFGGICLHCHPEKDPARSASRRDDASGVARSSDNHTLPRTGRVASRPQGIRRLSQSLPVDAPWEKDDLLGLSQRFKDELKYIFNTETRRERQMRSDNTDRASIERTSCQPPIHMQPSVHANHSVPGEHGADLSKTLKRAREMKAKAEPQENNAALAQDAQREDINHESDNESTSIGVEGQVQPDVPTGGVLQQSSTPAAMTPTATPSSSTETSVSPLTLLELCGKALYPNLEPDESKRSGSWEPVREWFENNPQCQVDPLLQPDNRGNTPLHIACIKKAPVDIISLMLERDVKSASVREKSDNMIPLHWACNHNCCPEVIMRVFEANPKGANAKSMHGTTPFRLARPGVVEDLINYILGSDYERLDLCKNFMSPDMFQEAVVNIVKNHNSATCIRWLNRMSTCRKVVFHMMLEFYLHVALITSFIQASTLHLGGEGSSSSWALAMLPISGVFLLLEIWQFFSYMWISQPSGYFLDWWNWIDLTTIGLTLASAIRIFFEGPVHNNVYEAGGTQKLLTATGFFLCVFFVSYLRKTLYSFAIFVGGMANIMWVLIPFMVVSFLLIGAFAFGYFVQNNNEDKYESLEKSFFSVYSPFIGAEVDADSPLDYAFGSLIILILLNVVIAVVGQAWSDVARNSKEVFWKYRLRFILEVTRGDRNQGRCCGNMHGLRKILDKDWTTSNLKQYLGFAVYQGRQQYWNPTRNKRDNLLQMGVTLFLLFCFSLVGLVSFGLLWPMFVLEFLFTARGAESSSTNKSDPRVSTLNCSIEKLASENNKQSEQITKQTEQIEKQSEQIEKQSEQMTKQSEQIEKQSKQIDTVMSHVEQLSRDMQLLVEQSIARRVDDLIDSEQESKEGSTESRRPVSAAISCPNPNDTN